MPLRTSPKLNSPTHHVKYSSDPTLRRMKEPGQEGSEGAATVEEDEDHRRSRQGYQGQGSEVGDQVEIDAHGWPSPMANALPR